MKRLLVLFYAIWLLGSATDILADDIRVGMTTALSGPAKALGEGMKAGVEAVFAKVNKTGGVKGKQLKLVALDDGYEPSKAAPNMRKLIDEEQVLAVIGNVGTPTAIVTVPIANEKKTLLFGAFTGAGVLRKSPPERYVINYRASYAEETAAMIDGLIAAGVKPTEFAFFTQNDGYGDAGYNGAMQALEKQGFAERGKLSHGRYTRNTINVEEALGVILDANVEPRVVIMVGAYAPCAKFIKLAKQELPNTLFLNVSFVGSVALRNALGNDAEGVIVTQVVPHYEETLVGVQAYRTDLKNMDSRVEPGFVSLEGYIAAQIFVKALTASTDLLSREALVNSFENLTDIDVGIDIPMSFSKDEHQASHKVWPTVIRGGKFESFSDWKSVL